MTSFPGPIAPPRRLLMGPGPTSAYPSVLTAMAAPLVGQYDPFMTDTMTETQALSVSYTHLTLPTSDLV